MRSCPSGELDQCQPLIVGGAFGLVMVYSQCRTLPDNDRPLYTILNQQLATELLLAQVAELIYSDAEPCELVIAAYNEAAAAARLRRRKHIRHTTSLLIRRTMPRYAILRALVEKAAWHKRLKSRKISFQTKPSQT